jgi:acyl carrier protein
MADTGDRIRDFLVSELHWQGPRAELTDDLPLIANHVVDSMGLLQLVAWLEADFGVSVPDTEIVPANFGTIAAIESLVAAKTGGGA